ncbi:MAG: NAD(P)H-hydrate epimerase, partial [Candidatus Gastranaerophilaceae bacterium]
MLKILSGQQMKLVDKKCAEEYNINEIILMENAGRAVYKEIINYIEQYDINNPKVVIICGKGNNGGDGFVAARHLFNSDINTVVISLFDQNEITNNAKYNFDILSNSLNILYSKEIPDEDFVSYIQNADIVVDAILGTGINSNIYEEPKKAVELINQFAEGIVISVDIPSGISSDTAKILGNAVSADCTICFETVKIGNIMPPAMDFNGKIIISNIGIPEELIDQNESHKINFLTTDYISEILPYRTSDGNKGDFGKILNIVGSKNLSGAGYLSAKSVFKAGAGYSLICCGDSLVSLYSKMCPDFIYKPYNDEHKGYISYKNLDVVMEEAQNVDAILLGCGLGTNQETVKFVKAFLEEIKDFKIPVIIDADGLNC